MTLNQTITNVADHEEASARTLALAFQDDPALSWIVPEPEARQRMLPRFFALMAEQSRRYDGVLAMQNRQAAALLYPAGDVKEGGFWDTLRLVGMFKTTLRRAMIVGDAMHAHHPRPQPYSYLRYLGVTPSQQGKGLGGAMVREVVARAEQRGQGVLLETATQNNVPLYSRLGFEIISEWEVPGGGPKFWTMVHPAP